jgi:hypothetical protein
LYLRRHLYFLRIESSWQQPEPLLVRALNGSISKHARYHALNSTSPSLPDPILPTPPKNTPFRSLHPPSTHPSRPLHPPNDDPSNALSNGVCPVRPARLLPLPLPRVRLGAAVL